LINSKMTANGFSVSESRHRALKNKTGQLLPKDFTIHVNEQPLPNVTAYL